MDRRRFLTASALALCGVRLHAAQAAAALAQPATAAARNTRSAVELIPADVRFDNVVRTTVGLRPHRDSGFLVKAVAIDDRTVVHNYGHGGAGMSLAWGTGALAAELALPHADRRAAVIGCGSPGLTAARQLQRRGFSVTIYAKTIPPDTTSNMSLAAFTPASGLVESDRRTPAWDRQFRRAAEISLRTLTQLVGRGYGVYWIDQYTATDDLRASGTERTSDHGLRGELARLSRPSVTLGPGEHPFPTVYAIRTQTLSIEPALYLQRLVADFLEAGGRIVIRTFDGPADLMTIPERVIINSTGLGSHALFNDRELVPVKGQLSVLAPQPAVRYRVGSSVVTADGTVMNVSMNPRSDGIVIGNLQERGSWSLDPDEAVRDRNIHAAMQFFTAMRASRTSRER